MSWIFHQAQWSLQHKVTFDGVNKLIIVSPNVTEINVAIDIYSDWKEWMVQLGNENYLPAIRSTGNDPTGPGQFSGQSFFMINGWRVLIDHSCEFIGALYSDDFPSPFTYPPDTNIVRSTVSSLVTVVSPTVSIDGIAVPTAADNAQATWQYINRTLTASPAYNGPTAIDIRTEIDNNSSMLDAIFTQTDTLETSVSAIQSDLTTIKGYTDTLETSATQIAGYVDTLETSVDAIKAVTDTMPTAANIADAVRAELTPELAHILTLENNPGLTPSQATMLLELYNLAGLDPSKPLLVTKTARTAGTITQSITGDSNSTTVTRV